MFHTKLILICAVISSTLRLVSPKQCTYVRIGDDFYSHQSGFVECRNVTSMIELSSDIETDWNWLKIINAKDDTFTTSDNHRSGEYIQHLDLSQAGMLNAGDSGFHGFTQLIQLNISSMHITTLKNSWFPRSNNIETLDISWNALTSLKQDNFLTLSKLVVANFSHNEIDEIKWLTFSTLRRLKTLNLSNNRISTIEASTFDGLENLEAVDLSANFLQSFGGIQFGHSTSSMPRKLRKLLLKQNRLTHIHPHTFNHIPNVEHLSLAFNSIDRFDMNLFLPLSKLKTLHINNNNIVELSGRLFNTTILLQELYMAHNKLTFFPDISNDFSSLTRVSLEGNPWQCPCLNDILSWIKRRGIRYMETNDNPYFLGLKPVCVITSSNDCVRDVDVVNEHRVVEKYQNALN